MNINQINQCVVSKNNRNDVEIQLNEMNEKEEDCLVQIRIVFPAAGEDVDAEEESPAETFQKSISEHGPKSASPNSIIEFDSDIGNFVNPRGRYSIAMFSTYLHMKGAKYEYKIQYKDIGKLFLFERPDRVTNAIIIALEKPIRQGTQKYHHLVLQTFRSPFTIHLNVTDEEMAAKGIESRDMTLPVCNLVAKVFKLLAGAPVSRVD